MAKPSLQNLLITNTFQDWFDRTNEVVTIMKSEVLTASAVGDTTGSELVPFSATLIGTFTANTVFVKDLLRVSSISPDVGDTAISISSPVTITSSIGQEVSTLFSTSGPRQLFSSGAVVWRSGFGTTSNNDFVINTGAGALKFVLTQTGNLTIPGTFTANNVNADVTGNLIGNVTGNVEGNSTTATTLAIGRSIAMTGDVTWSIASFNGSANVTAVGTIAAGAVSNSKFRDSTGLSVVGRSANTSGDVADMVASTDFSILRRSGSLLSFGAINLEHDNAVSNSVLRIKNGGTGLATIPAGRIMIGNGTSSVQTSGNLFWDAINNRLGIGTSSPDQRLHVSGNLAVTNFIQTNSLNIEATQVISGTRVLRNVTVDGTSRSSEAAALAGTDNTSIMTPLRTEQNVPRAIARMERADIGSYALLGTRDGANLGIIEFGDVISANNLYPLCIYGNGEVNNNNNVININDSFNIAGNWMCMGRLVSTADGDLASGTLFKRVS